MAELLSIHDWHNNNNQNINNNSNHNTININNNNINSQFDNNNEHHNHDSSIPRLRSPSPSPSQSSGLGNTTATALKAFSSAATTVKPSPTNEKNDATTMTTSFPSSTSPDSDVGTDTTASRPTLLGPGFMSGTGSRTGGTTFGAATSGLLSSPFLSKFFKSTTPSPTSSPSSESFFGGGNNNNNDRSPSSAAFGSGGSKQFVFFDTKEPHLGLNTFRDPRSRSNTGMNGTSKSAAVGGAAASRNANTNADNRGGSKNTTSTGITTGSKSRPSPTTSSPSPTTTPSTSATISPASSPSDHHQYLQRLNTSDEELGTLSSKLISAINNQTYLEDELHGALQEIQRQKSVNRRLEKMNNDHERDLSNGTLLRKPDVERHIGQLQTTNEIEHSRRLVAEKEKKEIETELEGLTAELFEEANKMVIKANREKEAVQRRNEMMVLQMRDQQALLEDQEAMIKGLKDVVGRLEEERRSWENASRSSVVTGDNSGIGSWRNSRRSTAENSICGDVPLSPRSPVPPQQQTPARLTEVLVADGTEVSSPPTDNPTPPAPYSSPASTPAPPLAFSQLMRPVCHTDLPAYEDFRSMMRVLRGLPLGATKSQVGSTAKMNGAETGAGAGHRTSVAGSISTTWSISPAQTRRNSRHPSTTTTATTDSPASSGRSTPSSLSPSSVPASSTTFSPPWHRLQQAYQHHQRQQSSRDSVHQRHQSWSLNSLRETRFFRRLVIEDIEPTLRLDLAPGVSWLSRRGVLGSICEGECVVEPLASSAKVDTTGCSLCGEISANNPRAHTFRTSATASDRHPLCAMCLVKIRSCCDAVTYLRLMVDGHVDVCEAEEEMRCWNEIVALREQMFWARIGGGVVPGDGIVGIIGELQDVRNGARGSGGAVAPEHQSDDRDDNDDEYGDDSDVDGGDCYGPHEDAIPERAEEEKEEKEKEEKEEKEEKDQVQHEQPGRSSRSPSSSSSSSSSSSP